jgi:NADPH:quinone reductase-like Zn-dependent oxidoreductase
LAGGAAVQALVDERQISDGARVLVHGAPGGVGLFAVALAKHLGAYVVATGHRDNVPTPQEIQADEVIDTDRTNVASLDPFDITIDLVGDDPILPVTVTKPGGHAVGLRVAPDPEAAAAKGVTANLQYGQITTDRLNRVAALCLEGVLRPHVAETYDLGDIEKAFRTKEAGGIRGKIAIAVR